MRSVINQINGKLDFFNEGFGASNVTITNKSDLIVLVTTNLIHIQTGMHIGSGIFEPLRCAWPKPRGRFSRQILRPASIAGLVLSFSVQPRLHAADHDAIDPSLNEHIMYVVGDPAHRAMLQVTTFYPDGGRGY